MLKKYIIMMSDAADLNTQVPSTVVDFS